MKTTALLVAAGLACAAAAVYEGRATSDARTALESARARRDRLQADASAARLALTAAEQAAVQAESALAAATPAPAPAEGSGVSAWLARLAELKAQLVAHPEQHIPELDLLEDRDLIAVARNANFSTEPSAREAFAAARTAAKQKFMGAIAVAARAYVADHHGERPASLKVIAPYFTQPAAALALQRYVDVPAAAPGSFSGAGLTEGAPVDPEYDTRLAFLPSGGSSIHTAPMAWIPDFPDRMARAAAAFQSAHFGATAGGIRELAPYISPPLAPAVLDRIEASERTFRGK